MWGTLSTSIIWILAVVLILAVNSRTSIYLSVVMEPTCPSICQPAGLRVEPRHILVAAIEHTIPERNVKVGTVGMLVWCPVSFAGAVFQTWNPYSYIYIYYTYIIYTYILYYI